MKTASRIRMERVVKERAGYIVDNMNCHSSVRYN